MNKKPNEDYVRQSNRNIKNNIKERTFGSTKVILKDPLPIEIDLVSVFEEVRTKLPFDILNNIDYIIIGEFEILKKRNVNAAYAEGVLYLTNDQKDDDDMIDDIIHELAYALEEVSGLRIYGDGFLESEFLSKRERLYHLLEGEGYEVEYQDFMNPEYTQNFDNFLYHEVGYPLMANISSNIFYSPYAATSLREYFANGFEAFYHHQDHDKLSAISPILFDKLQDIDYNKE